MLVMKTLEDGWYIVINAYKFTVIEIWGDFFWIITILLRVRAIPTYAVYRLYDMQMWPDSLPLFVRESGSVSLITSHGLTTLTIYNINHTTSLVPVLISSIEECVINPVVYL